MTPARRVTPGETRQCPACGGEGRECVGENYVTADMASDAGEPSMAGSFHSYEYRECAECGGSGEECMEQQMSDITKLTTVELLAALNQSMAGAIFRNENRAEEVIAEVRRRLLVVEAV